MRPLIIRLPYLTVRYEAVKSFSIFQNDAEPTSPPFQFMLLPEYGIGVRTMTVSGAATQAELAAEIQICPMFHWGAAVKALDEATRVLAQLQMPASRFQSGDYPILDLVPFTADGHDAWEEEREKARQCKENPGREPRVIDLEEGEQRPAPTGVVQDLQPQSMMPDSNLVDAVRQTVGLDSNVTDEEIRRRMQRMGFDMDQTVREPDPQIQAAEVRQQRQNAEIQRQMRMQSEHEQSRLARLQAQAAEAAAEASPVQPPLSRTPRGTDLSVLAREVGDAARAAQWRVSAAESAEWTDMSRHPQTQDEIAQDEIDAARTAINGSPLRTQTEIDAARAAIRSAEEATARSVAMVLRHRQTMGSPQTSNEAARDEPTGPGGP